MAEKELILKEKLEHSGIFDFPSFYQFAHSWFKEEQYNGVDEEKYAEKSDGAKRDIDIEWKAYKRVTDYFKIEHKVKYEIKGLTEVEVEIDGKKKNMNKGKMTVEITTTLVMDYDSKWETSPFSRFMRDLYNKYIIPSRVGSMRDKAESNAQNFKGELKAFLDLTARR